MPRRLSLLVLGACANALVAALTWAQGAPEVTLTRLDCGTSRAAAAPDTGLNFSDTFGTNIPKIRLVFSCYLIKHGNEYMVWDTGFGMNAGPVAPKTSLVDLLAQLNVKPEQVKYVGLSHYHGDHVGQAGSFPKATLLIGKGDWDILSGPKLPASVRRPPGDVVNPEPFANWISGGGNVEPLLLDKDVFGDGTVIMLNTPGHTPGHHVLLVKLPRTGNVMLSGDLAHFRENYDNNVVPGFNANRAETLASFDRVKQIAANLKATFIIQHDPRDVDKLPAFPASAQ
jgi:glyoxylase-like metal-dependent hydrolase (beta-lactamase superfamily II)